VTEVSLLEAYSLLGLPEEADDDMEDYLDLVL